MPTMYAETSDMRSRQVVWDLVVVAWVVLCVVLANNLHDLVMLLAVPGEQVADVGASLAAEARRMADVIADVPLVGPSLVPPFATAGEAAGDLAGAGEATVPVVERLAFWLAFIAGGVPVALLLVPYLWLRVSWVRRAAAVDSCRSDPDMIRVLAMRAVVNRPLEQLRGVSADPLRDLEERPELLAALELHELGLRPRA